MLPSAQMVVKAFIFPDVELTSFEILIIYNSSNLFFFLDSFTMHTEQVRLLFYL
jgi:hypothetical protein